MKAKIIEKDRDRGLYDFWVDEMILDHPDLGRIYISQGYGGQDDLRGGCYRWEHGCVIQLMPDDTLESLRADYNGDCTILDRAIAGHDSDRPRLDFGWKNPGIKTEKIVESVLAQ